MTHHDKYIYIIRHGETIWNEAKLLQGRKNITLSPAGMEQARKMANFFKDVPFDFIGASPLIRTQQTASIIGKELNIQVKTFDGLIARQYGDWEGKTIDTIRMENQQLFKTLAANSLEQIFLKAPHHSMESYHEVSQRALKPLYEVEIPNYALFVTHSGVISSILLALKFDHPEVPLISHLGYIKLRRSGSDLFVEEVNGLIEMKKKHFKESQEPLFIF